MVSSSEKRKSKILEAIIQDYVATALPVGSHVLRERHHLDVSPATIRIDMNDLEQDGYITHPHTSAGRIPTDKGYRHYVDNLLKKPKRVSPQIEAIRAEYKKIGQDIDRLLEYTLRILSTLSDYTAVTLRPSLYRSAIKIVQMVMLNLNQVMVVLLTKEGLKNELVVNISGESAFVPLEQEGLNRISNLLTEKLEGKSLETLNQDILSRLAQEMPEYETLLADVYELIQHSLESLAEDVVAASGLAHMTRQPEFRDGDKLNAVLSIIEQNKAMAQILKVGSPSALTFRIGEENEREEVKTCSFVMASYGASASSRGTLAILGPTRMHYDRASFFVEEVTRALSDHLAEIL